MTQTLWEEKALAVFFKKKSLPHNTEATWGLANQLLAQDLVPKASLPGQRFSQISVSTLAVTWHISGETTLHAHCRGKENPSCVW